MSLLDMLDVLDDLPPWEDLFMPEPQQPQRRPEEYRPSLNLFDPNQPMRMPVYVRLGNEVRLAINQEEADLMLRDYEQQQEARRRERDEEFRFLYGGRGPIRLDDMTYTNAAPPPPPPVRPSPFAVDWERVERQAWEERRRWEEEDQQRQARIAERERQEEERRALAREMEVAMVPGAGRNCICDQCHNARVRERARRRRYSFRPLLDTKLGYGVVKCWLHTTRLEGTCCGACEEEARKATEAAQNAMEVRARRVSRRVPTPANVPTTTVQEQLDLWWEDPLF